MSHELVTGSERTQALQASIQHELASKGYSTADDPVMAEYITIMLINSKTPEQITNELQDLIGDEYDPNFTTWLFNAKNDPTLAPSKPDVPPLTNPSSEAREQAPIPVLDELPTKPLPNRPKSHTPRPLINQALSGVAPSSAQKRTASARSPSPSNGPAQKKRHADLPDRPRAMREETSTSQTRQGRPSLLDRVGPIPHSRGGPTIPNQQVDRIQAQIDAVTQSHQAPLVQHQPSFNGFPMMMNGMMPSMMNPHELMQGMMEAQMAMAQFGQMAVQMGLVPGVTLDNFQQNGPSQHEPGNGFKGHTGNFADRGRRGRGGAQSFTSRPQATSSANQRETPETKPSQSPAPVAEAPSNSTTSKPSIPIAQPTPLPPTSVVNFNVPSRPLSPTLCKFSTSCTNPHCRYSHPSPAATPESGIVLSMEPCPNGLNCKDKDCKFAHASKAAIGATSASVQTNPSAPLSKIPCKYNPHCTRPGCAFLHFTPGSKSLSNTPCRFGSACTRADCPYGHPPGRVLPSSFSQGLGASSAATKPGMENSPHRSVDFRVKPITTVAEVPKDNKTSTLSKDAPPFIPKSENHSNSTATSNGDPKGAEVQSETVSVA